MARASLAICLLAIASACSHTDAYLLPPPSDLGPSTLGAITRLTFNPDEDYWPAWTQDGRGILYQYSQPRPDSSHFCIGMLPAEGGTQLWRMCDDRPGREDSASSFSAFALSSSGRLLYQEAIARVGSLRPDETVLWLADTAHPFVRRELLRLPIRVDHPGPEGYVNWLTDAQWIGQDEFVVAGQEFAAFLPGAGPPDTLFIGKAILRGLITSSELVLTEISGTMLAHAYALAEDGQTVVFSDSGRADLERVPITGGVPTLVTSFTSAPDTVLGVTCRGSTCLVSAQSGFWRVDLTSGSFTSAGPTGFAGLAITPRLNPVSNTIVAQVGGSLTPYWIGVGLGADLYLTRSIHP